MASKVANVTLKIDTSGLREELEALGKSFEAAGLTAEELSERIVRGFRFLAEDGTPKTRTSTAASWGVVDEIPAAQQVPTLYIERFDGILWVCLDSLEIVRHGKAMWGQHITSEGASWGYLFEQIRPQVWYCQKAEGYLGRLPDSTYVMYTFIYG